MYNRDVGQVIPLHPLFNFDFVLDVDFAKEMISTKTFPFVQDRVNELAEYYLRNFGIETDKPYEFYEDTSFVRSFRLGSNGLWLGLDGVGIPDPESSIRYRSQEADSLIKMHGLLSLVDYWAFCNPIFKGVIP